MPPMQAPVSKGCTTNWQADDDLRDSEWADGEQRCQIATAACADAKKRCRWLLGPTYVFFLIFLYLFVNKLIHCIWKYMFKKLNSHWSLIMTAPTRTVFNPQLEGVHIFSDADCDEAYLNTRPFFLEQMRISLEDGSIYKYFATLGRQQQEE